MIMNTLVTKQDEAFQVGKASRKEQVPKYVQSLGAIDAELHNGRLLPTRQALIDRTVPLRIRNEDARFMNLLFASKRSATEESHLTSLLLKKRQQPRNTVLQKTLYDGIPQFRVTDIVERIRDSGRQKYFHVICLQSCHLPLRWYEYMSFNLISLDYSRLCRSLFPVLHPPKVHKRVVGIAGSATKRYELCLSGPQIGVGDYVCF